MRRRTGIARQFFTDAVDDRLIKENPFAKVKGVAVRENRSRDYFVSREEIEKVISICPNNEWKLIVSLSRYLGLRIPSELNNLKWRDVDFEHDTIRIHAPKTEHHGPQHTERLVPIFADCELKKYLEIQRDELLCDFDVEAQPLSKEPIIRQYRHRENIRTQFEKLIKKAKLIPWRKLFGNCRSTRETELLDLGFKPKAVAYWLGHSLKIQAKHYVQVTEADYEKARGFNCQISDQSAVVLKSTAKNSTEQQALFSAPLGITLSESGRHWTRTSDLCRVKAAL